MQGLLPPHQALAPSAMVSPPSNGPFESTPEGWCCSKKVAGTHFIRTTAASKVLAGSCPTLDSIPASSFLMYQLSSQDELQQAICRASKDSSGWPALVQAYVTSRCYEMGGLLTT